MKNNTTIFLIRHGAIENPKNVFYGSNIDLELSETGRKQLQELGEKIKNLGFQIDNIYTSPLARAVESANILAKKQDLVTSPIIKEDLKDSDINALVGKSLGLREEIHSRGTDEYNEEWQKKGNEARENIIIRMKKTFWEIVDAERGKTVILVSHGDPIQFLLFALTYPDVPVPSMNILVNKNYPQKGEGVKLVISEDDKIQEKEYIK